MTDDVYLVDPTGKTPWHKTRLSADEWFAQNLPHRWRSAKDAMEYYTGLGLRIVTVDANYGRFEAETRYTMKRVMFWLIMLGIPSVGTGRVSARRSDSPASGEAAARPDLSSQSWATGHR